MDAQGFVSKFWEHSTKFGFFYWQFSELIRKIVEPSEQVQVTSHGVLKASLEVCWSSQDDNRTESVEHIPERLYNLARSLFTNIATHCSSKAKSICFSIEWFYMQRRSHCIATQLEFFLSEIYYSRIWDEYERFQMELRWSWLVKSSFRLL